MTIQLSSDKLGIDLDYRTILKDFSELYAKLDVVNFKDILNPKLNYKFWDKLVENWHKNNQVDAIVSAVDRGLLPGFEDRIDLDWLNLVKSDYNYQWRLHSFDFCPLLVHAYAYNNDIKYIDIIFNLLDNWKQYFIDDYYPEEVFPWNDHSSANRTLNLTYLFFFLMQQSYEDVGRLNYLKNIILCHLVVLSCRNFYSYHTNHGLFQANHAYMASTLLRYNLEECDFQKINFDRMVEEFEFSFTLESIHKENSPEYHFVIFKNFLHFNQNLKQLELEQKDFIRDVNQFTLGALKFLAYAIKPNGFLPTIGDTEEKLLDDLSSLKDSKGYPLYLYAQSLGKQGEPLPSIACAFEQAGYFFIKTNYVNIRHKDQFYLAAKSSFLSKYHRQDDDCNFVLSAYGEDWLVDGGLYKHEHHDPIREYMRSCYSHNLLMPIGGIIDRQNPPTNPTNWGLAGWMIASDRVEAILTTQMFQGINYERKFSYYAPFRLRITDTISNINNNKIDEYQLVFHFSGNKKISINQENKQLIVESEKARLNLSICNLINVLEFEILSGNTLPADFVQEISKSYNLLEKCQTIVFKIKSIDVNMSVSIETNIALEKKDTAKKVFILGSCVTRDALELADESCFKLSGYIARTSLASAFRNELVSNYDLSTIASSFQRRMVDNDLLKKTMAELINADFDFLVIDLIDERFDVVDNGDGQYFTLSSEFKDNIILQEGVRILKPNDDELFDLWCQGWNKLIEMARLNNFYHKIIINRVYWSNKDLSNELVFPEYGNWIDKNNQWLNRLYSYIEKLEDIKIISYPENSFFIDRAHKWGAQPYHYTNGLYIEFLNKLDQMSKL